MSISFLNTEKARWAAGTVVIGGAAMWLIVEGVTGLFHANHTAMVHTGHNMNYHVAGCGVPPGGDGSEWDVIFTMRNGNGDTVDGYHVQVEYDLNGQPVAWSAKTDMGSFDSGEVKTFHLHGEIGLAPESAITCKLIFSNENDSGADTLPVPAGG